MSSLGNIVNVIEEVDTDATYVRRLYDQRTYLQNIESEIRSSLPKRQDAHDLHMDMWQIEELLCQAKPISVADIMVMLRLMLEVIYTEEMPQQSPLYTVRCKALLVNNIIDFVAKKGVDIRQDRPLI